MPLGVPLLVGALAIGPATALREPSQIVNPSEYHVRASDPLVRAWIRNGAAESQTLNALLADLAASDVIVHVELVDRIAGGAYGQLYFVIATATVRYLRIEITNVGSRADIIALIAHELQHAAEVAASPGVRDAASLSIFYLGMPDNRKGPGHYDSTAARVTQDIVWREVVGHRGPPEDERLLMAQVRPPLRVR